MRTILILCFVFIAAGCGPGKTVSRTPPADLQIPRGAGATGIVYLTLAMTLVDSVKDEYRFEKISIQQAPGSLKRSPPFNSSAPDPLSLYCETRDANNLRVDQYRVQNPLMQAYEYSSETGKLDKALFVKLAAELILRFQISAATKYLVISKSDRRSTSLKTIYHAKI